MGVTARELLLPSASSIRRLAISESGFVFDPCSGRSFTVNDTGMEVLKALQEGLSFDSLRAQLASEAGWATEVPLPNPGDQRAWDALIRVARVRVGVEADRRLAWFRAQPLQAVEIDLRVDTQDCLLAIVAQRRLLANERIEAGIGEDLVEHAHAVGPFGMAFAGVVVEETGMREKEGGHLFSSLVFSRLAIAGVSSSPIT